MMNNDVLSLKRIKEMLDRNGFNTSWRNPFWEWMHPEYVVSESQIDTGNTLFVCDPYIPLFNPFDMTAVTIKIDEAIYFQLSMYYVNILEDQTDAAVINEIYHQHAQDWYIGSVACFQEIADKFSLKWDTEYDAYIEDSLYGHLKSEEQVLDVLLAIKAWNDWKGDQFLVDALTWTSDIPEIDAKLKEYRDLLDFLSDKWIPLNAYPQFRGHKHINLKINTET